MPVLVPAPLVTAVVLI